MADIENNDSVPSESTDESKDPGSIEGKGWDILVGGKDNPFASGGVDPFDANIQSSMITEENPFSKDAEADAILTAFTQPTGGIVEMGMPSDAAMDTGKGPEEPRDLTPAELSGAAPQPVAPGIQELTPDMGMPGVSPGVVMTPVTPTADAGIHELDSAAAGPVVFTAEQPVIPATGPLAPVPMPVDVTAAPPVTPVDITVVPPPALDSGMGVTVAIPEAQSVTVTAAPIPPMPAAFGVPFEVTDPFGEDSKPFMATDAIDLPPDARLKKMLITPERLNTLWDEISETLDLVVNDVRGHFNTTQEAIVQLRQARELIMAGSENYDNAEQLVTTVKARLRLEEKVRQWSKTRGVWLATYLVAWLLLLGIGSLTTKTILEGATRYVPGWMAEAWLPAIFGTLGGVVGALWILLKHMSVKRDFDPIHTLWYAANPFMGAALGVITYLVASVSGGVVTRVASGDDFQFNEVSSLILYALCIIVGFNQNLLWSLIDRFVRTVIPPKEEERSAVTDLGSSASPAQPVEGAKG